MRPGKGQVLDICAGEDRQDLVDTRAAEQDVNADFGRRLRRSDLAFAVE